MKAQAFPARTSPFPLFVVISGPSGVGKDSVLRRLHELARPYHFTVTATTRPRRPQEVHGRDYLFLQRSTFDEMVSRGEFLEWATVYGHRYGVPRAQAQEGLRQGKDVIVRTDVQGAVTIKGIAPQAVFIFLAPPSPEALADRLRRRHTEQPGDLELRLQSAEKEMQAVHLFDYLVVNHEGRLDETVATIEAIMTAERCRIPPRQVAL